MPAVLPIAVFPLHDPSGVRLAHLQRITPDLKELFCRAYVTVSPPTDLVQGAAVGSLARDGFFELIHNPPGSQVGDHIFAGYRRAVEGSWPGAQLHLCFEDRLIFALSTEHREAFRRDIAAAGGERRPILFQRSAYAWGTHPRTYRAIEAMATRAGEVLFGRSLDFAWCHLALRAGDLAPILPRLAGVSDLSLLAEIVVALAGTIVTRDVDWLAWEDPFIHGLDPEQARAAAERDPADHEKRLAYVGSMVRLLLARFGAGA